MKNEPSQFAESTTRIDINCDLGEGMSTDADIMPFISSANISCGYHAGDDQTICKTIELAIKHQAGIGAHVSFFDKANFGRTEIKLPASELYDIVTQQLIILDEFAAGFDQRMRHVKPHGALYNMSARDQELAATVAKAIADFDNKLVLIGLTNSHSIREALKAGLIVASEAFADRTYNDDGHLTPRSQANALHTDVSLVVQQVMQLITTNTVTAVSGKSIPVIADTICIHGDGANAVQFAGAIHQHLKQHHIAIKSF